MTLTQSTPRNESGGLMQQLPLNANAVPLLGSLLSRKSTGYVDRLTAGEPFAGISQDGIQSKDSPTVSGQPPQCRATTGLFTAVFVISGLTIADVQARRNVYASDDGTLTLTEVGNTYIGRLLGLYNQLGGITNGVTVLCQTQDSVFQQSIGSVLMADAPATLNVGQLDMLIEMPNSVARTLTLPPVASCAGRRFKVKKTTAAAAAVTLQANAAETIDGANTYATSTSQWAYVEIYSDGGQWLIEAKI